MDSLVIGHSNQTPDQLFTAGSYRENFTREKQGMNWLLKFYMVFEFCSSFRKGEKKKNLSKKESFYFKVCVSKLQKVFVFGLSFHLILHAFEK